MKQILLPLLLCLLVSCGRKTDQTASLDSTTAPKIAIEPATGSPPYPDAKLVIVSPKEGEVLKNALDSVRVVMQVTGMELAIPTGADSTKGIAYSKQGQHIHVIIDEKPYMADYKNGQPFNVGVLAPGKHTIRAFPSYSWHESIKAPESFAARTFSVGAAPSGNTGANDLKAPLLTYSRPKGSYTGSDAGRVLLDFFVANATLGPDAYRVMLAIDGNAITDIVKWQPYFITGLAKGKHTISLQLIDRNGKAVPGGYNNPSQEITIG